MTLDQIDEIPRRVARQRRAAEMRVVRQESFGLAAVSYTHLRAHETVRDLVCRLLLEKKKKETY